MNDQSGKGDSIQSTITGDVTGQVAVGKDIRQRQTIAAPEPPTEAELEQLRAAFAELKALVQSEAPPDSQAAAAERVAELEQATISEKPDVSTMEYVKNWFSKNLPKLAGAVTGVLVNPIVGKLVQAAGDTVAEEFRRRFGEKA